MHRTTYVLASFLMAATLVGAADPTTTSPKAPDFEALKKLAGDWHVETKEGFKGTARYQVTSGDSAVIETANPGTANEMVTIYTREGDNVAATHYCPIGNQPHLLSKPATPGNQLHFDFVSGGNMKSVNDEHMHSLTVNFVDDNHVRQEWKSYANGKPTETAVFELTRKS